MPRQFTFNPEDDQEDYNYRPTQMSRRVKNNLVFEENDSRFKPQPLKSRIGFVPEEEPEEKDPYGYNEIINRYRKELGGEQPALSKYRQAIQNTPQQQDYDLGKWGKIGAALSGFGAGYQDPAKGIAVARELREAPWQRALKQHETDIDNLGTEAEFEQKDRAARMKGLDLELDTVKNRRTADREDMNIGSQIQRRQQQTKNELSRLGIDTRRLDWDIINGMSDNELAAFVANETVRHNQSSENTANFNANTSRGQLGVSQGRLGFDKDRWLNDFGYKQERDRVGDYQWGAELSQNDRRIDNQGSDSWVTPNVQRDAEDTVATTFYREPMYRKFLTPDANGRIIINPNLDESLKNTPEYEAFELAMAGEIDKVINTKRGHGTGNYRRVQ